MTHNGTGSRPPAPMPLRRSAHDATFCIDVSFKRAHAQSSEVRSRTRTLLDSGLEADLLISTKAADANIYKKPDGTTTKDSYNRTAGEAGSKSYSPDVQGWPVIGHCRVDFRLRRCFPDLPALLPPVLRQDSAERRQMSRCVLCLTW